MDDLISRQAAIELFKDDAAAVNELNNLPPQPDRMKYVQKTVHTIMNTCKNDSIKDKAFRNAARLIQNAIDGEAPEFEVIEELPSAQPTDEEIQRIQDIEQAMLEKAYWLGKQDAMQWIPTSERPPKVREWVLCQCRAGIMDVLRLTDDGSWNKNYPHAEYMSGFVIAWMPLPDSWKGEEYGTSRAVLSQKPVR